MRDPLACFGCHICQNGSAIPVVRRFACAGCHRLVPWCYSADDNMFEYCDDCWEFWED